MTIWIKTAIGTLQVEYVEKCITRILKVENHVESDLEDKFDKEIKRQFDEYFEHKRKKFEFAIAIDGTEFQKKVWNELLKIPYGETITYSELAKRVGSTKGMRAVGNANGKNKILIVVPCHRVVAKNGIGGFSCGIEIKKTLLELEHFDRN